VSTAAVQNSQRFAHEALLYAGDDGFVAGLTPFIREGVALGEPVLVVVAARKVAMLREALNGDAAQVHFADMADVGANPARIIPAWQDFVDAHLREGRPVRGVGEPIYPERSPAELVECQRHEALLNVAFARSHAWQLVCPYDTVALPPEVIEEALRTHPTVRENGSPRPTGQYYGTDAIALPFALPLPPAPDDAEQVEFGLDRLGEARRHVYRRATHFGLGAIRTNDLVLAVNELLSNSVRHGGGSGVLRIWQDDSVLVCEVGDRGRIADPLADRTRPDPDRPGGRGLWMANQLCDLVQVRAFAEGNVVRVSMRRGPSGR